MDKDFRCKGTYRGRLCDRLLFVGKDLGMTGIITIRCSRCSGDNRVIGGKLELLQKDDSKIPENCI